MKAKDRFDSSCAELWAEKIKSVYAPFNDPLRRNGFIAYITKNVEGKEFTARQDVFADAFDLFLTGIYEENLLLFEKILGPELEKDSGMFSEGWWLWPLGKYVERHVLENGRKSLAFIRELTKRFTGEFAIRPLVAKQTKQTLRTLEKWSRDANVHVRRLSSEGMRIALPWAKKSYAAVTGEFETYKKILGNLKNDPSRFVQKSVGNNLNDLFKEFPDKAQEIIKEWNSAEPSKETAWIIKHGLRSLEKKH